MKKRTLVALLVLDLLALGLLRFRADLLILGNDVYRVESYDGGRGDRPWFFPPMALEGPTQLDISYEFRVAKIEGYLNLFQTAPAAEGLRMELSAPSILGLVVPQIGGGIRGFVVTEGVKLGVWHKVHVLLGADGMLTIDYDGVRAIRVAHAGGDWKLSEPIVGQGLNAQRVFRGQLRNFALSRQRAIVWSVREFTALSAILTALAAWLACRVGRVGRWRMLRWWRLATPVHWRAAAVLCVLPLCLALTWRQLTRLSLDSRLTSANPFNGAWLLWSAQLFLGWLLLGGLYRYRFVYRRALSALDRLIPLRRLPQPARFAFKAAFLLVPPVAYLGNIEFKLRRMPTNYSEKRRRFEPHLPTIETLILGSSNAYYGIDPRFLAHRAYNLTYRAQPHYFDVKLAERYVDRMPRLKLVIVAIIYFNFGGPQDGLDAARVNFYAWDWGIPRPRQNWLNLGQWLEPNRFTLIHFYGERLPFYIESGFKEHIEPDAYDNGWFDSGTEPCDLSKKIGPWAAPLHNAAVQIDYMRTNAALLQQMADRLKARGIEMMLVQMPALSVYYDFIDKAKYDAMEAIVKELAAKNGMAYTNHFYDPRFTVADFTVMPDHLNAVGAEKYTRILNQEINVRYGRLWGAEVGSP